MENNEPQAWNKPTAPPKDIPAGMNAVWDGVEWQLVPNPVHQETE